MSSAPDVPQKMRAILIADFKGPSQHLYLANDVAVPTFSSDDQVLVKIKAFGVNRMDILQREGGYALPPGASQILGVEFAGTIAAAGSGASEWRIGQEVFGLATGGAYAEYIAVPKRMVLEKPAALSWAQAAAIPENFLTAFQALTLLSNVQPGEDVLIHAGASGVGLAAIQLARNTFGAQNIFVTVGSDEKAKFCESIGATKAINYKACAWAQELKQLTQEKGVNVIMDFIGAPYFSDNLASLQRDGRLVMQGAMGGQVSKEVNVSQIIYKRLKIEGSTLRSRSLDYQSALVQQFIRSGSLDMIVKGAQSDRDDKSELKHHITIHQVFRWQNIKAAHDEMEANKNIGKIVVMIE